MEASGKNLLFHAAARRRFWYLPFTLEMSGLEQTAAETGMLEALPKPIYHYITLLDSPMNTG